MRMLQPMASHFECATAFNLLVDRISQDADFLQETLSAVSETDPFTAKLLALYNEIYVEKQDFHPAAQADRLGLFRSGYMLQQGQIKQVELNTIASSFAGLSSKVSALHSFLIQRYGNHLTDWLQQNKQAVTGSTTACTDGGVPPNPALQRLACALSIAHARYKERFFRG